MKLTEFTKTIRGRGFTTNEPSSVECCDLHGRDFFDAWDRMFNLRTIPEQPGRYKDE